jgi:pimeloyl-ACP methyl ester carboxylesterase
LSPRFGLPRWHLITPLIALLLAGCVTASGTPTLAWIRSERDASRVIVFVSGFRGDSIDTWSNRQTEAYWPRLLVADSDLNGFGIAAIDYQSAPFEHTVRRVENQLHARGIFTKYKEVYFVAHSMGGLVIKRILIGFNASARIDLLRRIRLVALLGTPSQGAPAAAIGSLSYPELEPLGPNSDYVQLLDTLWGYFMRDRQKWSAELPRAACAYETATTAGVELVNRVYANSVCDDFYPFAMNHTEMAKPESPNADQYLWVRRHILETKSASLVPSPSIASGVQEARVVALFRGVRFVQRKEGVTCLGSSDQ